VPFGLNIAPQIFIKLCTVIIKELCLRGIKIFAYLDDWLVWASFLFLCCEALDNMCLTIQKYRFKINAEKSSLVPTQKIQWLGIVWNTRAKSLSLPVSFQWKVQSSLKAFVRGKSITCLHLERVIGL